MHTGKFIYSVACTNLKTKLEHETYSMFVQAWQIQGRQYAGVHKQHEGMRVSLLNLLVSRRMTVEDGL